LTVFCNKEYDDDDDDGGLKDTVIESFLFCGVHFITARCYA